MRKLNEKLLHLSDDELNELLVKYDAGFKNKVLVDEYKIEIHHNSLSSILPYEILEDERCPYCDIPLKQKRLKSSYGKRPFCDECGHEDSGLCSCSNCKQVRQRIKEREREERIQKIESHFGELNREPVLLKDIPAKYLLYIAAFIRATAHDNLSFYRLGGNALKLSPLSSTDSLIIEHLYKNGYLKIYDVQNYERMISQEDFFDLGNLSFELNISDPDKSKEEILERLFFPSYLEIPEAELRSIWIEIAVDECVDFIISHLRSIGINYKKANEHSVKIRGVLRNYSVGQFWYLYNRSLKSANMDYCSHEITANHCVHKSIYGALAYSEKCFANNWEVFCWNRNTKKNPQSILSELFFNKVLKIGEAGFTESPYTYICEQLTSGYLKNDSDGEMDMSAEFNEKSQTAELTSNKQFSYMSPNNDFDSAVNNNDDKPKFNPFGDDMAPF